MVTRGECVYKTPRALRNNWKTSKSIECHWITLNHYYYWQLLGFYKRFLTSYLVFFDSFPRFSSYFLQFFLGIFFEYIFPPRMVCNLDRSWFLQFCALLWWWVFIFPFNIQSECHVNRTPFCRNSPINSIKVMYTHTYLRQFSTIPKIVKLSHLSTCNYSIIWGLFEESKCIELNSGATDTYKLHTHTYTWRVIPFRFRDSILSLFRLIGSFHRLLIWEGEKGRKLWQKMKKS